jgi:hypothetical protein
MQNILSFDSLKNKSPKIEIPEKMVEMMIEVTREIIGDDIGIDKIEMGMNQILKQLREKSVNKLIEVKNPNEHICLCGCKMNSKGFKVKKVVGLGAYMLKRRLFYCQNCGRYEMPIDTELNCPSRYTLEVKKAMILLGQRTNFEEASHFMKELLQVEVSHEKIQEYVEEIGNKINKKDDNDIKKSFDKDGYLKNYQENLPKDQIQDTAYLMMDGSMVWTREEGWKETRLGILFASKNIYQPDQHHRVISKKKYFGCHNKKGGSLKHFQRQTTYEAYQFGFQNYKHRVILGDGAQCIWEYASSEHPNCIQILDYYHASEYLGTALNALKYDSDDEKKRINQQQFNLLWDGKVKEIIAFLNKQPAFEEVTDCIRYYTNNEKRMKYAEYRKADFEIGSGAIESAHKIVIQSRMKQAGMRWSNNNVQSIISLRAKYLSGQWDQIVDRFLRVA